MATKCTQILKHDSMQLMLWWEIVAMLEGQPFKASFLTVQKQNVSLYVQHTYVRTQLRMYVESLHYNRYSSAQAATAVLAQHRSTYVRTYLCTRAYVHLLYQVIPGVPCASLLLEEEVKHSPPLREQGALKVSIQTYICTYTRTHTHKHTQIRT